jgi:hypothetical protein
VSSVTLGAVTLLTGTAMAGEPLTCEITRGPGEATCGSSNNVLDSIVTGGVAPYTYDWNLGTADPGWALQAPDNQSSVMYTAGPPNGQTGTGADVTLLVYDAEGTLTTCSYHLRCGPGEPPPPPPGLCRVTGGGNDEVGANKYTFGGQAGAPTASQPQPYGEWTHSSKPGSAAGRWTFHAGTASAPVGTEIDLIECCDPGNCLPARHAPNKQINFEGIGTFKNLASNDINLPGVVVGGVHRTYHWFEVHIEDLGEPGNNGHQGSPGPGCPAGGSNCAVANCACPDFYRITIYAGFDPSTFPIPEGEINKTDVLYSVQSYLDGGNLQIHPAIGDLNNSQAVNQVDMNRLLSRFGPTRPDGVGDLNNDGKVDQADVAIMLENWGSVLP